MLLASLSPVIVMSVTSGMAALILSAAVWAVICPPGWGAAALVVAAAALPPLLSWWLGAQATAQAITTAKQIDLSTGSEIMNA
jgi:amino acid permease